MNRSIKAWLAIGLGFAGIAVHFVWPPLGVAVTFAAVIVAFSTMMSLNVPPLRAAYFACCGLHALDLYLGSRRFEVAGVALLVLVFGAATEPLIRRLGYHGIWISPVAYAMALVLLALSLPLGNWDLALSPSMAFGGFGVFNAVQCWFRYRRQHRPSWSVKIGDPVPDFELSTRSGADRFRLSEQRGRHVLLCLLQGDWCPVCHVMMRIYNKEAPALARHNVKFVVVSGSCGPGSEAFEKDLGVDYMLLADPDGKVAGMFGALFPNISKGKDVALPSTFLIDPSGCLKHASRPDAFEWFVTPTTLLGMIEPERDAGSAVPRVPRTEQS